MPARSRFILWTSILLAGIFLYLALRGVDWQAFLASIKNLNYSYLPLIFFWGSSSSWMRAMRWRVLLSAEKEIPTINVFWANMAGYLGNNILPARAGELIRAAYVSRENNIPASFSLATGLVERFIDLIALVVLGSISLTIAGILSQPLQSALRVMSAVAMIGFIALLITPYFGNALLRIAPALPALNASAKERLGGLLEQFLRGIEALHHPGRAAAFILFTSLIWLMDAVGIIVLARALYLQFTLAQSFVLLAALGLSSAVPSTPGYIGVYQFAAVIALQPFGIAKANTLAFIISLQILNLLVVAFWGTLAAWRVSSFIRA